MGNKSKTLDYVLLDILKDQFFFLLRSYSRELPEQFPRRKSIFQIINAVHQLTTVIPIFIYQFHRVSLGFVKNHVLKFLGSKI